MARPLRPAVIDRAADAVIRDGSKMIDNTRRISERSVQVTSEAARTITEEINKAADRFQRAA
jgi:hypothetical protein